MGMMQNKTEKLVHGFTMIEMMIVVVIVGILSAVAIPAYINYYRASLTGEATSFLGSIRKLQDEYRSEMSQFAAVNGNAMAAGLWTPVAGGNGKLHVWTGSPGLWEHLGAAPDGPVRFKYFTIAGGAGNIPGGGFADPGENWFISEATIDMDRDGDFYVIESTYDKPQLFMGIRTGDNPTSATTLHTDGWE